MGYLAPVGAIDVSNSNTPAVVDPTNSVTASDFRVVATVDENGSFRFTKTNAYSGNNGRAAILKDKQGANVFYTVGNAGNGGNPQPNGIIIAAGAQLVKEARVPLAQQPDPGLPTPVGSFNVTQLGLKADKTGKDTNFRGLTVFNNVIYMTKGSGSNGVNTVYFIDNSGFDANGKPLACPNGVGAAKRDRNVADDCDRLHRRAAADAWCDALQHVRAEGISDQSGEDRDDLPVRNLVCESQDALCRRRGRRHRYLQFRRQHLHGGCGADHRGSAEMGVQRRDRLLDTGVYAAGRP
ncbi:hypothetical protein GCM10007857_65320 [Bradyrhizobium iriomotense]|uniref:Phytase-like domain-containing protein n=2 Tax=Bradyrhizobium iriomotense TaxID=441950 RepID=A0ABQ6B6X3_9BRAD|nr:hypothetical protein GCM10007857_65320 [Bradyrhizobium iriomotense]